MEYKFLEELTYKELKELESVLLEENKRKEFMGEIEKIKNRKIEIARIYEKNSVNPIFNSDSVPNYDSQLENKCNKVLKNILVNELPFLLESMRSPKNTMFSDFCDMERYYKSQVKLNDDLRLFLRLSSYLYFYYKDNKIIYPGEALKLKKVDDIFKNNPILQEELIGPYNMLNYIKNYIYFLLKQNPNIDRKDVFKDYSEKKELVSLRLGDISAYLSEIKNGTNLKLCIFNNALSKSVNKVREKNTMSQSLFIDALAFGTTLEKIENRDYEDYQKLFYLPQGKKLMKKVRKNY